MGELEIRNWKPGGKEVGVGSGVKSIRTRRLAKGTQECASGARVGHPPELLIWSVPDRFTLFVENRDFWNGSKLRRMDIRSSPS